MYRQNLAVHCKASQSRHGKNNSRLLTRWILRHTWTVKSFCNTEPKICVALKRMLPLLDKNPRLKVRQFDRKECIQHSYHKYDSAILQVLHHRKAPRQSQIQFFYEPQYSPASLNERAMSALFVCSYNCSSCSPSMMSLK